MINSLTSLENKNIEGKVFLVRIDTNVSVENEEVKNDFRLRSVDPTLKFLLDRKAKVVVIGHREPSPEVSLKAVALYYEKKFPTKFFPSCKPEKAREQINFLKEGEMLVLENLRSLSYEKENSESFARALSSLADVYVNEAFSVSHREHASIVGVPRFLSSFSGFCFEKEVKELSFAFSPERPFVFVLGGLKFKTKAPLIEKFLKKADTVFVGGALANSFFKERGWGIGTSAYDDSVDLSKIINEENLFLPVDVTVLNEEGESKITESEKVSEKDCIVDIGPRSLEKLNKKISSAKLVVWNGPMGNIERGFNEYTHSLASLIAKAECYSIVGGGDTVLAIDGLGLESDLSFISTGGGAMLDFLVHETLPGIKALKKSPSISF
jgi:phosphoglycerate kinase